MTRDEIKKIVYDSAANQFYDEDEFNIMISKASNDGEDLQLYNEVGFDSLDMVEFMLNIESKDNLSINLPDNLFTKSVTFRNIIDYIYEHKNE